MEGLDEQVSKLTSRISELVHYSEELQQQKLAMQQALEQQRCGRCGGPSNAAPIPTTSPVVEVHQPVPCRALVPIPAKAERNPWVYMAKVYPADLLYCMSH